MENERSKGLEQTPSRADLLLCPEVASCAVDALHRYGGLFNDLLGLLWPRAAIHVLPRKNGSFLHAKLLGEPFDANLLDVVGESH